MTSPDSVPEPLDLAEVGDRHDARHDRASCRRAPRKRSTRRRVRLGAEEQLGDGELRAGLLLVEEDARVEVEVVLRRVPVGEGRDARP